MACRSVFYVLRVFLKGEEKLPLGTVLSVMRKKPPLGTSYIKERTQDFLLKRSETATRIGKISSRPRNMSMV